MAYTICEKVFIGGMALLFLTVLIILVFLVYAASFWLKNKREERRIYLRNQQLKAAARSEQERQEWTSLLAMRDQEIASLKEQVSTLTRSVDMTRKLLETSEAQRAKA